MSKKILSVCLALVFLCTLAVPVFAAEGVVENWYNTQQPYGESIYFYNDRSTNHYTNYTENGALFNNIALNGVTQMSFGFSDDNSTGGWEVSMVNAFDYYANVIIFAETDTVSDFSFYPTDFGVTYKAHDDTDITRTLQNVSISHYDTSHTLGYSACGRIPFDSYFGNPVKSFDCYHGNGSVPANIQCFLLIYQVPKSDDGVSADAAAIVAAIQDQTTKYLAKVDEQTSILGGLIQGNGGDPAADQANNDLAVSVDRVDEIEEEFTDTASTYFDNYSVLTDQFDITHYLNAGEFYVGGSDLIFEILSDLSVFVIVPLILLCFAAFIGKLR